MKNLLKIKNFRLQKNYTRYEKKCRDKIVYKKSLRFNCKKRNRKRKILFWTKSKRDTEKMLGEKIVRFKKIPVKRKKLYKNKRIFWKYEEYSWNENITRIFRISSHFYSFSSSQRYRKYLFLLIEDYFFLGVAEQTIFS